MLKKLLLTSLLLLPTMAFSNNELQLDAEQVHPNLVSVRLLSADNEVPRYRVLQYRGGHDHVASYMVVQRLDVIDEDPYITVTSEPIHTLNFMFDFDITAIEQNDSGFAITLDAVQTYSGEEDTIELQVGHDLSHQITFLEQ